MGKGDKRSKKGKIFRGSFGKRRPGKRRAAAAKKAAQRAAAAKKAR
jgi:30S ribosomal protein S31